MTRILLNLGFLMLSLRLIVGRVADLNLDMKNENKLIDDTGKKLGNAHFTEEFDESRNDVMYSPDSTRIIEDSDQTPNDGANVLSDSNLRYGLMEGFLSMATKIKRLTEEVTQVHTQNVELLRRISIFDCSSLTTESKSGVHDLYPTLIGGPSVRCFCDMDTNGGNWTVILNRVHHTTMETALNFTRTLREYKIGFGDPEGDFWAGLENIYQWTKNQNYELRIELEDFSGSQAHAHYDIFYIDHEYEGYRLHAEGYSGDAGDSLTNWGELDNYTADGMMFSSHDADRDTSSEISCSKYWDIGGWWFNRCSWANLMGPYRLFGSSPSTISASAVPTTAYQASDDESGASSQPPSASPPLQPSSSPSSPSGVGINWHKWRNQEYLRAARMMIRPSGNGQKQ